MRGIAIILSASILAVFSFSSEHSPTFQNFNSNPAMTAQSFYYMSRALPETRFYHPLPPTTYYSLPYPYVHLEPKLVLNNDPGPRSDMTNPRPALPSYLIDQNISDNEAVKQLEDLKEIYSQNNGNEVVFPSIISTSRGFIALKASALVSFLNSFSLATVVRTKTKIIVYPTIG